MAVHIKPLLAVTLGFTLVAAPAQAQESVQGETVTEAPPNTAGETYNAAYFERYAPSTARDMIAQVPGFQLDFGDNRRGLGQGGANLLINGERLTGKTDPGSQLSRIAAKNVVRIDIVDGASLDIPGLSGQVANVITKSSGVTGTFSWEPEARTGLEPALWRLRLTVSGETGNLSYSSEIRNTVNRGGNRGPEFLTAADGRVFERRDEDSQFYFDGPGASIDLTWKPKTDHIGNLNLEYNQGNFNETSRSDQIALTDRGSDIDTVFTFAEDEWNASVGADYEFPVGPGKLKTIGYYRFEHSPTEARFDIFAPGTQTDGSRFGRVADEAEAIARTEYSWSPQDGRDWTLSAEGAFNFLDIISTLRVFDDGEFVQQDFDGNIARVEEKRAETTLTHSRKLSDKWDVQLSAGVEYSELTQTGDTVNTAFVRDFIRPKGFISATYKPSDSFSIRSKVERDVGQLNFFDFISSLSIVDGLDNTGNVNLVPSQSWLGELEFDKDFGQGTTFKARFYGALISDLVDRIPVGLDGDAVGNINSAQRYGVDFDATVKGDRWGLNGTELTAQFQLRNSHVDDPLTQIERRLNGDKISYWFLEFRHDIPNTSWAYGLAVDRFRQSPRFRLNTISRGDGANPFGRAYIEHKDILGLKIRAEALNLFGARDDFTRQIFDNRRDIGLLDFTEARERSFDLFGRLRITGTF